VSQVDVEECINSAQRIVVSRTIAVGDLINAVMKPDSESKTPENKSSDEEIVTERISWAKAADTYFTLLKVAENRPFYSAQEVMQLLILHCTFLHKRTECTKQAINLPDVRESL